MPDAGDAAVGEGYRALRTAAAAVDLDRDAVAVAGPDAEKFLQGQLSQDVAAMAPGDSVWSLLLQPQGKMVALLRVTRNGADDFVLDTDGGWGSAVVERLRRYKLRVKCDVEPLDWRCVALRGPEARASAAGGTGLAVGADWPGLPGVDLLGEAPRPPSGIPWCPPEAWEAVRIECGFPLMGRELDERTIPAEAGLVGHTVSFTKGCYTGQELVARIDSRGGNVARHLRGVIVAGDEAPPVGAAVRAEGKDVGSLTSVARSPGLGAVVGLAYVGRAVSPPAEVELAWADGSVAARVEALPLQP